jgi:ergothioneine biosynthesis protein EgtB
LERELSAEVLDLVELGMNHEQQHQELILTDVKYGLAANPLRPAYREARDKEPARRVPALRWKAYPEGVYATGHDAGSGFAFDNEGPRHQVFLPAFRLASRLVTNSEYMVFMRSGGYETPALWLSDGLDSVRVNQWSAPLYWEKRDGEWWNYTLDGMRPVRADAFARWAGARLATEAEWEVAAQGCEVAGNFVESDTLHPRVGSDGQGLTQMFGDVWEWTASAYLPYPGYKPATGAVGEYNGKFMSNQMVLRGGSCVTPQSHIRNTYRNFFPPHARWQFMGIRLANGD